ncbi:uncharacterized protein LOC131308872 [Rhododendron vialii]|uniref:uncharacterized protein LOC131308872 n=1 Tax=Rhododendron vialii TaxID=182163 RepID=UPI00265D6F5D|nr:uncharacterized protein LOC131308872 [Rhododendron vialii]
MNRSKLKILLSNVIERAMRYTQSINWTSILSITRSQLQDLMVLLTFEIRIANRGLRQCQDAVNLYLAVLSIVMARSMPTRCVTIGVRVQKTITQPPQRPTFSRTC